MHIVGDHQWDADFLRNARQLAVAHRVPLQKVSLKRHIDRVGAEPGRVLSQQRVGLLSAARQRQPRERAVTSTCQQNDAL